MSGGNPDSDTEFDLTLEIPTILPTSNTPHKNSYDDPPNSSNSNQSSMMRQVTPQNMDRTRMAKVNMNKKTTPVRQSDTLKEISGGQKTRLEQSYKKLDTPSKCEYYLDNVGFLDF